MDWDLAIKRKSEALNAIVAALFAMLGLVGEATVSRIPKPLHSAVLRVLRPAESAVRRLIIIAARGLVVKVAPSRPMPKGLKIGKGGGGRLPAFQLYDTRKYFPELRQHRVKYAKNPPRIHFFEYDPRVAALWPSPQPPQSAPAPAPLPPDGLVNAERITRRLQALKSALDDLPRQARRMARWRVRRENMPNPKFKSPLRPGRPPGYRRRVVHEVDELLAVPGLLNAGRQRRGNVGRLAECGDLPNQDVDELLVLTARGVDPFEILNRRNELRIDLQRTLERFDVRLARAVTARHFGGVDPHFAIIDL